MTPSSGTTTVRPGSADWTIVQLGDPALGARAAAVDRAARLLQVAAQDPGARERGGNGGRRVCVVAAAGADRGRDRGAHGGRGDEADGRAPAPAQAARAGGRVGRVAVDLPHPGGRRRSEREAVRPQAAADAVDKRGRALRPLARVLGQRVGEHAVEPRGQLGPARADARRRLGRVGVERRRLGAAREDDRAGQALEDGRGEGVAVGGGRGLGAADDLGREVGDRADQPPGLRDARLAADAREAEVAQVGVVGVADEDVLRLHVAVHEAHGVRGVEGGRDLAEQRERALGAERALVDQRGQRRAGDEPQRQVQAVVRLARLVDGDDVRVLERRLHAALAAKALDERLVEGELAVEDLESDLATGLDVASAVDSGHPAATEQALDAVAAHHSSGFESHGSAPSRPPSTGAGNQTGALSVSSRTPR